MVLLKRNYGKFPKIAVKWVNGPYKLVKKIGQVNWVVKNGSGKEKVYHQDLVKKAGKELKPTFVTNHQPYSSEPMQAASSQCGRVLVHTNNQPLINDNSQQPVAGTVTRSGRLSRPVLGSRLIDQIGGDY